MQKTLNRSEGAKLKIKSEYFLHPFWAITKCSFLKNQATSISCSSLEKEENKIQQDEKQDKNLET